LRVFLLEFNGELVLEKPLTIDQPKKKKKKLCNVCVPKCDWRSNQPFVYEPNSKKGRKEMHLF